MTHFQQRAYVRDLARKVAEIASTPEMDAKRRRWADAYMLRKPDRVPVWRRPTACREELLPESSLRCADPFLRRVESELRWTLLCHELGDDAIVLPYWRVPAAIECANPPVWGVETRRVPSPDARGAWAFDPPVKSEADLDRLRIPKWRHDEKKTQQRLEQADELLGDILPVRLTARCPLSPGLGGAAARLIGLDALMLNVALKPDMMHRLMAFLRDSVLSAMDQIEAMGVLTENNDEQIHFSESLKTSPPEEPVRFRDLWVRTESQEFELIGPDMWREFLLDYQMPILTRHRYVSYGCCENLTPKLDGVFSIPNLRIFVNGPWTELEAAADRCRGRACLVWRQKAADVIFADDLRAVRAHLEEGLRITQGCRRAIVLQEIMTTNGNPGRLKEWTALAIDAAERLS